MIIRIFLLIFGLIGALNCLAIDFYDNGFAYSIISETEKLCGVEYNEEAPYSGDVTIPTTASFNGVTYQVYQINSYAFNSCDGVTSLTIPPSLMSIKNNAFEGCRSLKKLIIEDSEKPLSIGYRTGSSLHALFYGSPLNYIYLGRNLQTYINGNSGYYGPFSGLPIHEVYMSDYVTELPSYIFAYSDAYTTEDNGGPKRIQSIRFSPFLTKISSNAFNQSLNMSILEIPENVEIVGSNAFYGNNSLKEVYLGSKITKLESYAFSACSNISVVHCHSITPPSASGAANTTDMANARLRVPSESVMAYKNDSWWKNFGEILPLNDSEPAPISPLKYKIIFPETGAISQYVKDGQVLSFDILPNQGWVLHSLIENGVEISEKLDDVGNYTTNPIHQDTELSIIFKADDQSTISNVTMSNNLKVYLSGHTLKISGEYNSASLFKIDGTMYSNNVQSPFEIENYGIYILKIDNVVFKFAVSE